MVLNSWWRTEPAATSAQLADAAQGLVAAGRSQPALGQVANTFRVAVPSYQVKLDNEKAQTLGIPRTDVYDALQTFLGGLYVNDFNRFGRTWRVIMQAEPEYRRNPDAVNRFYVRTSNGDMVPLSTLVTMNPTSGPDVIYRFNRYRAAELIGQTAPGFSSGQSAAAMEEVASKNLPAGFGYEWTGTVFQQKLSEGKEGFIFGFAAVLVFLFLAAQYESWSIPFAVVLAVPLGMFGALVGVMVRVVCLRCVHADRHRHADRSGVEECHPDCRVRAAEARKRDVDREVGA